jgi:acetyl-CoA carboxylase carboxyltransferase component
MSAAVEETLQLPHAPAPPPHMRERVAELRYLRKEYAVARTPGHPGAQKDRGKLSVRERLDPLFDEGTFTEVEPFRKHRATGFGLEARRPHTDGVVTGWGLVHGRTVFACAHDLGSSEERSVRPMLKRSTRSWTLRSLREHRSSGCGTALARESRRV